MVRWCAVKFWIPVTALIHWYHLLCHLKGEWSNTESSNSLRALARVNSSVTNSLLPGAFLTSSLTFSPVKSSLKPTIRYISSSSRSNIVAKSTLALPVCLISYYHSWIAFSVYLLSTSNMFSISYSWNTFAKSFLRLRQNVLLGSNEKGLPPKSSKLYWICPVLVTFLLWVTNTSFAISASQITRNTYPC